MNVRGLQNIIESAAQTDQPFVTAKDVSRAITLLYAQVAKEPLNNEQIMICEAMERASGNIQRAAKAIGWSRQRLYRMLEHYGIDRLDFLDIRGFSWLAQAKKESEFEEKRRTFRMEMVGGPLAFFG